MAEILTEEQFEALTDEEHEKRGERRVSKILMR
jgi:hypothetical protein